MPWPLASKEFNHVEKNIVLSKRMSKRKKQKSLLSGNFFSRKREKEKAVEEFLRPSNSSPILSKLTVNIFEPLKVFGRCHSPCLFIISLQLLVYFESASQGREI